MDLPLEGGEALLEFLRHHGQDAAVHRDARDLHAREDGDERQLDLVEDASERRALGEARRERVHEREREARAGSEPPPAGFPARVKRRA